MCRSLCSFHRLLLITGIGTALLSGVAFASDVPLPVRFTAFAIDVIRGGGTPLDGVISRWSTGGDVEQLSSAFNDRGTDGLLRALDHVPRAGYFRANGGLASDVQFAQHASESDGGQRIFLIAERRLGFDELAGAAPSAEYPLTVIELHVNTQGEGTGTMWPIARITYWDPQTQLIIVDNYTMEPVQLMAVRLQKDHVRLAGWTGCTRGFVNAFGWPPSWSLRRAGPVPSPRCQLPSTCPARGRWTPT